MAKEKEKKQQKQKKKNIIKSIKYTCNMKKCDFTSDGKGGLNSHIQLKNFIYQHLLKNKSQKEFAFKECGYIFINLKELQNHNKNDCEKSKDEQIQPAIASTGPSTQNFGGQDSMDFQISAVVSFKYASLTMWNLINKKIYGHSLHTCDLLALCMNKHPQASSFKGIVA